MQTACQNAASRMPTSLIMFHYEKAWQDVRSRIARAAHASRRDPETVRLVAVSKTFPAEAVRAVHALGQRDFGENYVQEGARKVADLADLTDITWHLIGPLQSNKARGSPRRPLPGCKPSTGRRSRGSSRRHVPQALRRSTSASR